MSPRDAELWALTLKHPWAFAIMHLGKRYENRSWPPPARMVGKRIALHGGAPPRNKAAEDEMIADATYIVARILRGQAGFERDEEAIAALRAIENRDEIKTWVLPGIFGTAVIGKPKHVPLDYVKDRWAFGPYAWPLEDFKPLESPIAHRGAQNLWRVGPAEAAQVWQQVRG